MYLHVLITHKYWVLCTVATGCYSNWALTNLARISIHQNTSVIVSCTYSSLVLISVCTEYSYEWTVFSCAIDYVYKCNTFCNSCIQPITGLEYELEQWMYTVIANWVGQSRLSYLPLGLLLTAEALLVLQDMLPCLVLWSHSKMGPP